MTLTSHSLQRQTLRVRQAGAPQRKFKGVEGVPPPPLTMALSYLADFTGNVGDLKAGASVTLHGFTVGDVRSVRTAIDPKIGADRHCEPRCEL
jgi:hypothetical protein